MPKRELGTFKIAIDPEAGSRVNDVAVVALLKNTLETGGGRLTRDGVEFLRGLNIEVNFIPPADSAEPNLG